MNGALIGFGVIAMGHLAAYATDPFMDIVAIVDPSSTRREAAQAAGLRTYSSYEECLRTEQLDFIDICTPPTSHAEYMNRAMDDGLDVLCEKPVFLAGEPGFEDLINRIARTSGTVYPIHNYKFAPVVRRMLEISKDPSFGEVVSAHFRTTRIGHARGAEGWYPDWRRDTRHSAGGILRDHGPHSLYMAEMLTGALPRSVSCLAGTLGSTAYGGTEDTALVRIKCDRAVEVLLDLTWAAKERSTRYSLTGTGGSLSVENDRLTILGGGRAGTEDIPSDFDDPSHTSWFSRVLDDFRLTRASEARRELLVEEARRNALLIDAAYRSSANDGEWVDLPGLAPEDTPRPAPAAAGGERI
ncbi:Gfo/Idh/MocA family oxidoreductase [Streptomyces sp. BE147]|uniref:Gfo/Idh/MocA family protein n=1 Tax=Streptomyces sp. BE147 TaxID=3002524 RepID=UPI002E7822C3|nr:Gfo/Idh/MocA family oxidoreductase [Streptomyces sp. BE147]MEE1736690.1 Gfo/Idh/MocA family oxidoreductase [Streptomyces sp. BE147]